MTGCTAEKAARAAAAAAARTLSQACDFAALHATAKPLFQKTMRRRGSKPVLVRVDWPGVLSVFDPSTGECLARSEVGAVYRLEPGFAAGVFRPRNEGLK